MENIVVYQVGKPTKKGRVPFAALLPGHGLLRGFAGSPVAVGDVVDPSCLAHDHENGRFWLWLP